MNPVPQSASSPGGKSLNTASSHTSTQQQQGQITSPSFELADEDAMAESAAMRNANSRRGQTSITHLMNFTLPPRPQDYRNTITREQDVEIHMGLDLVTILVIKRGLYRQVMLCSSSDIAGIGGPPTKPSQPTEKKPKKQPIQFNPVDENAPEMYFVQHTSKPGMDILYFNPIPSAVPFQSDSEATPAHLCLISLRQPILYNRVQRISAQTKGIP
ncbi:hypothetical protein DID88_009031 [Monilinia fructigena]|uniref:Uncharacterized protein n=1 Tax=Monilinia fructigena TaxID=38457 RepID=A0A395IF77_9HELO|nr:hypothetical protein DID88_009031 [Monilinia fructigena]